jgi:hypothetical protein
MSILCKLFGHDLSAEREQLTPCFCKTSCLRCSQSLLQYKWYKTGVIDWEDAMRDDFIKVSK